ncbi:MAG: SMP-30/gluconolactonase/LRE family protein [Spongiibacteraceae bacterium]|nr:SMP-30/gluconolactonase/LRE family protein [Spongiibacteraceae bacterium]
MKHPQPMATDQAKCVWQQRSDLGEGIIWCPNSRALWWTDILGHQLFRYSPDTDNKASWAMPEALTCIVPCSNGHYLSLFASGLYLCQLNANNNFVRLNKLTDTHEVTSNRPNDGCCDYWGNLWFGTMDNQEQKPTGAFYRYSATTGLSKKMDGIAITNGPAVVPPLDGNNLSLIYYTNTLEKTIYQANITSSGDLLNAKPFYQFTANDGYPDGMAIDADYHVWCCLWGEGKIVRINPAGKIVQQCLVPTSNVTKCAFAKEQRGLYVTTARKGLSANTLEKQPLAGSLFYLATPVGGLPSAQFKLNELSDQYQAENRSI